MPTEDDLVIKTPDHSYEGRSWFTRYRDVLAAMGVFVAVIVALGGPLLGVRDQARDAKIKADVTALDLTQYKIDQAALAIREEADTRLISVDVARLTAKVDLLVTVINQKGK